MAWYGMRPNVKTFTLYNIQFTHISVCTCIYRNTLTERDTHICTSTHTLKHSNTYIRTLILNAQSSIYPFFFFISAVCRISALLWGLCTMNKRVQFHRHTYKCISVVVHNAITMYVGCTYETCIAWNLQMYMNALLRLLQCNRPARL